ncbi:hypothetical protein [Acanthopleuribacter pedis]|uniref:Aminoacyl-transfer RNA synthetases class-II family profile domain-containing protein n=1 Tax=Acanthopleuribacter pedis TaxID=442870 RepID=A0A8J7QRW8_9BACT|nr:hypothetical protein [Acanthopleuribacter pedis]MBO1323125.1 hypothetical protein [Acanthopleuribacter pedis]
MTDFRRKVLLKHQAAQQFPLAGDAALAASPDVIQVGPGLIGFRGALMALYRFFEHRFLRLSQEFEAEQHHYPVMLPLQILHEVSYFSHFPQQVLCCAHLPDDLPVLESAAHAAANHAGTLSPEFYSQLAPPKLALKPAVCLPSYSAMRGHRLAEGETRVITMQNHVFRRECTTGFSPARLWDFQVRDIVFFGAYADLRRLRQTAMERTMDLCRELDLSAEMELANDPFFLEESRDKIMYQRLGEVKYELSLAVPHREKPVAASSFNLHRGFYTSIYDIGRGEEGKAESACMGFGLERWLYGFVAQKGLDPDKWPDPVRRFIKDASC